MNNEDTKMKTKEPRHFDAYNKSIHGNHQNNRTYIWLMLLLISTVLTIGGLVSVFARNKGTDSVAIVVLGGGLTSDGKVPIHSQLRLDKAVELYNTLHGHAKIVTLSGGTPHKPNPRDKQGFAIWEASAAAKRLVEMGVPSHDIYEENFSLDTIGNAYFLRAVHLTPGGFRRLIVVTNDWHMDRTRAIFERVLNLPEKGYTSSAYDYVFPDKRYDISFEPVDSGIPDPVVLKARREREKKSLQVFQTEVIGKWDTFQELHDWIYTEHDAYASKRLTNLKLKAVEEEVLKTY